MTSILPCLNPNVQTLQRVEKRLGLPPQTLQGLTEEELSQSELSCQMWYLR